MDPSRTERQQVALIVHSVQSAGEALGSVPTTYATENKDPILDGFINKYRRMDVAGRDFPACEITQLIDPINPFSWAHTVSVSNQSRELVQDVAERIGIANQPGWGIGGSRLLGYERPGSDIDFILNSQGEALRDALLTATSEESKADPTSYSTRAKRFASLYKGNHLDLQRRNIFGGLWQNQIRLDIYATFPQAAIARVMEVGTVAKTEAPQLEFEIVDDRLRAHYPIILTARSNDSAEIELHTFDPAALYFTCGDRIVANNIVSREHADGSRTAIFDTLDSIL